MIPEQFIQELKARSDIEGVISTYVQLKRGGRNLVGLCPFHSEKSPSFTVYQDSQSFYCFGCGAGGDVITFLKRAENLDYVEAIRLLADRAGMQMPDDGFDDGAAKRKTRVLEINRQTARFFHAALMGTQGAQALAYLRGRQLSDKTIRHFGLGYAPESWDALSKHLHSLGFSDDELTTAAVAAPRKKGDGVYDQFRNRVMFPIIDIRGNVIGFGGRVMEGSGPKYLNSSDTPVFKKSRNLFALNLAKATKQQNLLLAEGYMDVIALHQAGFDNAVATLGTALTDEQARLVGQYAKQVVIAYDSDGAGQTATKRAINIFGEIGLPVKVLSMQGAKDPDEFIQKYGRERFSLLIEGSSGALDFELKRIRLQYDTETDEGKVGYLKEFASFIAGIRNPIERDVYIARTATELGVAKEAVASQVSYLAKRRGKTQEKREAHELRVAAASSPDRVNPERARHLREALAEERLIAILYKNPDYLGALQKRISPDEFVTAFNRDIYAALTARIAENRAFDLGALASQFDDAQVARVAGYLAAADGQNYSLQDADDYIAAIRAGREQKSAQDVAQMSENELAAYIAKLAAKKK